MTCNRYLTRLTSHSAPPPRRPILWYKSSVFRQMSIALSMLAFPSLQIGAIAIREQELKNQLPYPVTPSSCWIPPSWEARMSWGPKLLLAALLVLGWHGIACAQNLPGCQNVLLRGGGPPVADNTAAWNASLTAGLNLGQSQCLYFPQGSYSFAGGLAATIAANGTALTVVGDGPELTQLTLPSGITVTELVAQAAVHFRDISIVPTGTNSGIGIDIEHGNNHNNELASNTFERVKVGNPAGSAYYATDIKLNGVSMVNFSNVDLWGQKNGAPTTGVCLDLEASSSNLSFIYNIVNSNFFGCEYGLYYGSNVQGVAIANANFTLNKYGIYVPASATGQAQLSVVNSQFDNVTGDVDFEASNTFTHLKLVNNLFYLAAGDIGVRLKSATNDYTSIGFNSFSGQNGTQTGPAIQIDAGGGNNTIDNTICVQLTTCVQLGARASGWMVKSTTVDSNAKTIVSNAGTANVITGFIQPSALSYPRATAVSGAASSGGLIELTVASSTGFIVGEIVFANAGGIANMPGIYSIGAIPDGTHITLAGSAFSGAYTSGGLVVAMP